MNKLKKYIQLVDSMNEKIGKAIAWLTLLLVLVVCFDVVSRYVFKSSSVGVQELEWHLFAVIFLMGGAYTLKHEKHVRVDIIFSRLTKKKTGSNKLNWHNIISYSFLSSDYKLVDRLFLEFIHYW